LSLDEKLAEQYPLTNPNSTTHLAEVISDGKSNKLMMNITSPHPSKKGGAFNPDGSSHESLSKFNASSQEYYDEEEPNEIF